MIDYTLSKKQADRLFDKEAVFFWSNDGIPEHRIVELFGEWAGEFIVENAYHDGHLIPGTDWNAGGSCSKEEPLIHYFCRSGFYKIVSKNNYRLTVQAHRASEGGKVMDEQWKLRRERIEAAEAEDERRRAERRAKREAAKRAKQEAQNAKE